MDLSCFLFLTIMNNAFVNICVQVFVWIYIFIFLEYKHRYEIAGSYDVCRFYIFEELPDFFQKWLCYYVPTSDFSTYSSMLNIIFFILSILLDVKCYLIVVLIFITLMTADLIIFSCACWPFVCLCSQILSPVFIWVVFLLSNYELFIYSRY